MLSAIQNHETTAQQYEYQTTNERLSTDLPSVTSESISTGLDALFADSEAQSTSLTSTLQGKIGDIASLLSRFVQTAFGDGTTTTTTSPNTTPTEPGTNTSPSGQAPFRSTFDKALEAVVRIIDVTIRALLSTRDSEPTPPSTTPPAASTGDNATTTTPTQTSGDTPTTPAATNPASTTTDIPSSTVDNSGTGTTIINNVYNCVCDTPTQAPAPTTSTSEPQAETETKKSGVELGKKLAKTGEFLWKPEAEKDGKLAVLLPSSLTGKVSAVVLIHPDGSRARQTGRSSGVGNGNREHFRFTRPGGEFADGTIVLIKMKDGSRQHMTIEETSKRVVR